MRKLSLMSKMGIVFLTWRRALQKELVPHKITLNQQYVLNQLTKREFLYPSQIADMLFCDRPTATVIIKNIEREKWVRREKDIENAKQIRIYITEEGRQKLASLKGASGPEDMALYDPLMCLTDKEKEQLDTLLTKVLSNLKENKDNHI
ncbi:MAG TPA: MarR family transcriptional regulator [Clostridia bacterium]|nr:MarR family transcriptional regulator [Clostridia bacterium]